MTIVYVKNTYQLQDEADTLIHSFGDSSVIDTATPNAYDPYSIIFLTATLLVKLQKVWKKNIGKQAKAEIGDDVSTPSGLFKGDYETLIEIKLLYDIAVIDADPTINVYDISNTKSNVSLATALIIIQNLNTFLKDLKAKQADLDIDIDNATILTIKDIVW